MGSPEATDSRLPAPPEPFQAKSTNMKNTPARPPARSTLSKRRLSACQTDSHNLYPAADSSRIQSEC